MTCIRSRARSDEMCAQRRGISMGSLSPFGERVGVRGLSMSIDPDHNPSPHPSPYGRGSRPSSPRFCASTSPEHTSNLTGKMLSAVRGKALHVGRTGATGLVRGPRPCLAALCPDENGRAAAPRRAHQRQPDRARRRARAHRRHRIMVDRLSRLQPSAHPGGTSSGNWRSCRMSCSAASPTNSR